jgi:hypothetical protein
MLVTCRPQNLVDADILRLLKLIFSKLVPCPKHTSALTSGEGSVLLLNINNFIIQWKPLNVITLGQTEIDNIY